MEWKTEYLIPGMVLKNDLLPENGPDTAPLLPAGKVITFQDIVRLTNHKIASVEIEPYNETFFDLLREYDIAAIQSNNAAGIAHAAGIYDYIVTKSPDIKFDMTRYLNEDIEFNEHEVNVTNMAVALAAKHNNSVSKDEQIDIKEMAEVALLADVGRRAKVPAILEKLKKIYGSRLDKIRDIYPNLPEDIFEHYHRDFRQFYSYLILKGGSLTNTQLTAILLHHENEKGKNGPLGIEMSKQVSSHLSVKMAKILRVCELYDVLLYRAKNEFPDQPFGHISQELDRLVASGLADPYWTKLLKTVVPVYPLGDKVELSDGTVGIVAKQNNYDMSKPYVKDLNGDDIDLNKEQLVIIGLCIEQPNEDFGAPGRMSGSA